jgi:hypothetical protein
MRRVPDTGDEKQSLWTALDRHRDVVVWKAEGLAEDDLRRPMTPSGTSLLGLVQHLAAVEYGWFAEAFGDEVEPPPFDPGDPGADMRVAPGVPAADVLAYYARARASSDRVVARLGLADTGRSDSGEAVTLRWVLIHMIEETCRHAGHMDIVRELVDGAIGDFEDFAGRAG